jgi:putative transposase
MVEKFLNKYRIPSARAAWHDYNGGDYFITICTGDREHYFGEIANDKMILNVLGIKLNELIADIPAHHPYATTPVYQVMPNHVHLIVCIDDTKIKHNNGTDADCTDVACRVSKPQHTDPVPCTDVACRVSTDSARHVSTNIKMQEIAAQCGLLSTAMGGMKSALTKYANANKIKFEWQTRFHDHIIRDWEEWERIANYIENNPATWKEDKFFT